TQTSRVLAYMDGVPIVHGTVAAVVRLRRNRRLTTWQRPVVRRKLYACLSALAPAHRTMLLLLDIDVVDATPATGDAAAHPFTLPVGIFAFAIRRDTIQCGAWCAWRSRSLFVSTEISSVLAPTRSLSGFSPKRRHSRCRTHGGTKWSTAFATAKNSFVR